MQRFRALSASLRGCFEVLPMNTCDICSYMRVNTSLSETLFFCMCWCIRNACISIPECTQRLSHTTSEGNMAKKAKKAKKAKSAVKKTAKKTRKVAKKKK